MPDNLLMPEGSDPYYGQKYNQDMNNLLMQRASVLPLAEYANGRVGPAVPGILMDGWNAFWNAGDAAARGDWRGAGHAGAEAAGLAMTGALAMPRPTGSIGMGGTPKPAPQSQPGIRAYHGSPHDFDRFDMSKIGTGEGAQAYGHGLYFAENEGVAKSYRSALSGDPFPDGDVRNGAWQFMNFRGDDAARSYLEKYLGKDAAEVAFNDVKNAQKGRLYEVRINADPNDFLDWDKPLSQQPKVAGLVGQDEQGRLMLPNGERAPPDKLRGESFYRAFAEAKGGGTQPGSQALRDAGIPGIKYLDQGSRSAGEGSRNYVVFRDDIIDIVKKYGIAAAASMYGMDAVNNAMGAAQDQPQNLLMQGY